MHNCFHRANCNSVPVTNCQRTPFARSFWECRQVGAVQCSQMALGRAVRGRSRSSRCIAEASTCLWMRRLVRLSTSSHQAWYFAPCQWRHRWTNLLEATLRYQTTYNLKSRAYKHVIVHILCKLEPMMVNARLAIPKLAGAMLFPLARDLEVKDIPRPFHCFYNRDISAVGNFIHGVASVSSVADGNSSSLNSLELSSSSVSLKKIK